MTCNSRHIAFVSMPRQHLKLRSPISKTLNFRAPFIDSRGLEPPVATFPIKLEVAPSRTELNSRTTGPWAWGLAEPPFFHCQLDPGSTMLNSGTPLQTLAMSQLAISWTSLTFNRLLLSNIEWTLFHWLCIWYTFNLKMLLFNQHCGCDCYLACLVLW